MFKTPFERARVRARESLTNQSRDKRHRQLSFREKVARSLYCAYGYIDYIRVRGPPIYSERRQSLRAPPPLLRSRTSRRHGRLLRRHQSPQRAARESGASPARSFNVLSRRSLLVLDGWHLTSPTNELFLSALSLSLSRRIRQADVRGLPHAKPAVGFREPRHLPLPQLQRDPPQPRRARVVRSVSHAQPSFHPPHSPSALPSLGSHSSASASLSRPRPRG